MDMELCESPSESKPKVEKGEYVPCWALAASAHPRRVTCFALGFRPVNVESVTTVTRAEAASCGHGSETARQ